MVSLLRLPLDRPANSIALEWSSSFSVSVVFPASGCEMIASVRRCSTSRRSAATTATVVSARAVMVGEEQRAGRGFPEWR
jgi:hypothetical protein